MTISNESLNILWPVHSLNGNYKKLAIEVLETAIKDNAITFAGNDNSTTLLRQFWCEVAEIDEDLYLERLLACKNLIANYDEDLKVYPELSRKDNIIKFMNGRWSHRELADFFHVTKTYVMTLLAQNKELGVKTRDERRRNIFQFVS